MDEVNPNDAAVREAREKAIDYAERVQAGEEPWLEVDSGEPADSGFDSIPEPADGTVDEVGAAGGEVVVNPVVDETPESSPEG